MQPVFITGGTGYMGRRLISILLKEGYNITALVRQQSINKLPEGCGYVIADPFNAASFVKDIKPGSIFIHLLGVSHPGPKKKELFYSIDLASAKASAEAAKQAGVQHFIYLSVAQTPTKIMADYQEARRQAEQAVLASGVKSSFIRPWYVVGPGHYWPLLFLPFFKLLELIPPTSQKAKALRLVSLKKMLLTLKRVVQNPPKSQNNIIEIDDIHNMM